VATCALGSEWIAGGETVGPGGMTAGTAGVEQFLAHRPIGRLLPGSGGNTVAPQCLETDWQSSKEYMLLRQWMHLNLWWMYAVCVWLRGNQPQRWRMMGLIWAFELGRSAPGVVELLGVAPAAQTVEGQMGLLASKILPW
jgi:hypothetical protein